MNNKLAYCNVCEDLVEYDLFNEMVDEEFKGKKIHYRFCVGRCKECHSEVTADIDYNSRRSFARIEAYKQRMGLIGLKEISEIMEKYDIGKEVLADVAGFGKVTIKRYFDGVVPSKPHSDVLFKMLSEESYFMELVGENKDKLKKVAFRKIMSRYSRLKELDDSKIDQIANYIITHLEEVTPLALEKLLSFSNGVNYALNGSRLIFEESQAWAHGPVYPQMYNRYKRYGFKPIDDGINSTHGCMLSKLSMDEIRAIDLVINTFGLYAPKILEKISHSQDPWTEKRIGYKKDEPGREVMDEDSIKRFYVDRQLNSEKSIMKYIMTCIKNQE